jgi:hypothetical protein
LKLARLLLRILLHVSSPGVLLASSSLIRQGSLTKLKRHCRTTLGDILSHSSEHPYTFEAFVDFLARNHCLETLEFISEVKHYRESYNLSLARFSVSGENPYGKEDSYVFREWQHLKDAYIVRNAPREINIPGWMRDTLMEITPGAPCPPPILLEPVLHYAYEMLAEDAVLPFIRSLADIADTNGAAHPRNRRNSYEPPHVIRPLDETITLSSYVASK